MTGSFPSSFSHNAWSKKATSGQLTMKLHFLIALVTLASRSRSAIEPSLRLVSPENGHNAEDGRRFPAQQTE
jgi:hypothetical protein